MKKLSKKQLKDLSKIVDDSVTVVTIATPINWKCKKKECFVGYKHSHGTFKLLLHG